MTGFVLDLESERSLSVTVGTEEGRYCQPWVNVLVSQLLTKPAQTLMSAAHHAFLSGETQYIEDLIYTTFLIHYKVKQFHSFK